MLTSNLYQKILLDPPRNNRNLNNLFIVSGYASAAMASRHLVKDTSVKVNLLCGMVARDGISLVDHQGFRKLVSTSFPSRFSCFYAIQNPIHSKVYVWCDGKTPRIAFCGSGNYSQNALLARQKEAFADCNPAKALAYYQSLAGSSISCVASSVLRTVNVYAGGKQQSPIKRVGQTAKFATAGFDQVTVSLLVGSGQVARRSGLNWGQRPEENRNPNQAYIALPAQVYRTDFFPARPARFTILTDDGVTLVCARAQDNSKAIHTTEDNSLLGAYFRGRLGLQSGAFVERAHLDNYGRTDVDFYKIDNESYYMDFSV